MKSALPLALGALAYLGIVVHSWQDQPAPQARFRTRIDVVQLDVVNLMPFAPTARRILRAAGRVSSDARRAGRRQVGSADTAISDSAVNWLS
jgi:hypothetical protein